MKRWLLCLVALGVASCTPVVLTPFEEVGTPEPEERVFVTMAAPEFEAFPDGALFFVEIPEWDVLGVPAFVMDGILVADFSVPSARLIENVPVVVILFLDDPSLCEGAPVSEALGYALEWDREARTAEFELEPNPEFGLCE